MGVAKQKEKIHKGKKKRKCTFEAVVFGSLCAEIYSVSGLDMVKALQVNFTCCHSIVLCFPLCLQHHHGKRLVLVFGCFFSLKFFFKCSLNKDFSFETFFFDIIQWGTCINNITWSKLFKYSRCRLDSGGAGTPPDMP